MPPTPSYTVACLGNREIARDVWEFTLERPAGFSFTAGQFVLFDTPLVENPADRQPRAFSISSGPEEKDLLFVAKMKEGGRASRWIAELLRPGTPVGMQGPFGLFTLPHAIARDVLFIATSSGIAPFRSMLESAHLQAAGRRVDLVFGVRHEDDLFWMAELEALKAKLPGLAVHVALTQPSAAWKGHTGRVQTLVPAAVRDLPNRLIYACGSPAMTKELKELCLGPWGVPKPQTHFEGYI